MSGCVWWIVRGASFGSNEDLSMSSYDTHREYFAEQAQELGEALVAQIEATLKAATPLHPEVFARVVGGLGAHCLKMLESFASDKDAALWITNHHLELRNCPWRVVGSCAAEQLRSPARVRFETLSTPLTAHGLRGRFRHDWGH
jgi:hypothetical protein